MSINPQTPHDFIENLFHEFKSSNTDQDTVRARLLQPIETYIRQTRTQDPAVLQLQEQLIGMRNLKIEVVKSDTKIYQIFANALGSGNIGQASSAAAQVQDSAIACSTGAEVSDLRADLGKVHQILSSLIDTPDRFIEQDPADTVQLVFNRESFNIELNTEYVKQGFTEDLRQLQQATLSGVERQFPNIFVRDHQPTAQRHSCSFEKGEKIIPTFNMALFLAMGEDFLDQASTIDKQHLFNLLLLCNTQDVPSYFALGVLVQHLNSILANASINLKPHLLYNIDFRKENPNRFLASVTGNIYFVPQKCVNYSQQQIDDLFKEIGIKRPPRIELTVDFQMGWESGEVSVNLMRNEGRVVCLNPQEASAESLSCSSKEELVSVKDKVIRCRKHIAEKFDGLVKKYLSLIPSELRSNLNADEQTVECDIDIGDHVLVEEIIPSCFANDHVLHQRCPTIKYKIGDAVAKKIVDENQAKRVICDAKEYAISFSKDLEVNQKIFGKILSLCTQQLSNSVVGIVMALCNMERLQVEPELQANIFIDHGEVTLGKVKSFLGPDQIKVNYDFHAILSPLVEAPDPDLEANLKALGLYQIIGVRLSGSFILDLKKNGEFAIKDFKPRALLDQV